MFFSGYPAKLSFGGKRGTGVFPRLTICKSCGRRKLPGREQECHKRATVVCQAGGPGACAPPTAAMGGRLAPPRVTALPAALPLRAGRGGTRPAGRGASHAPPRAFPRVRGVRGPLRVLFGCGVCKFGGRGELPSSQSQSPAPGSQRQISVEITKTLCHFGRCLGANL